MSVAAALVSRHEEEEVEVMSMNRDWENIKAGGEVSVGQLKC